MLWVLEGHITEETKIYPQDVVCLGPHLPPQPYHAPRHPILSTWAPSQEEMGQHVLQSCHCQFRRYLLLSPISLCMFQVFVEVAHHQQL